jgi:hypothetical protein
MHPRYHLPLTLPLALLGGVGLVAVREWKQRIFLAGAVYVAAAPIMHLGFIRNLEHADLREYAFLMRVRDAIPRDCHVVEFAGKQALDGRFHRLGAELDRRVIKNRFRTTSVVEKADTDPVGEELKKELQSATSCTYVYEGLPCYGVKHPDQPLAAACSALRSAARRTPESLELKTTPTRERPQGLSRDVERLTITWRVGNRSEMSRLNT